MRINCVSFEPFVGRPIWQGKENAEALAAGSAVHLIQYPDIVIAVAQDQRCSPKPDMCDRSFDSINLE